MNSLRDPNALLNFLRYVLCLFILIPSFASSTVDVSKLNYHVVNVVWGRKYTDTFLQASLPLQMCSTNLGALPRNSTRYRIFTTQEDWEYMQSDPNMKRLQQLVQVEFIEIEPISFLLRECDYFCPLRDSHNQAVLDAKKDNAALIFLVSDLLISNQTFQTILKYASQGKRLLLVLGASLKKDEVVPIIRSLYQDPKMFDQGMNPRDLVYLAMNHLHPVAEALFATNQEILHIPYYLYWKLDNYNMLGHGFNLYPLFVWPEFFKTCHQTIDGVFPQVVCPSRDKWAFLQDSDEGVVFEISDLAQNNHNARLHFGMMRCSTENIAKWLKSSSDPHSCHRFFPQYPFYMHSSDMREEWKEIADQADAFIQDCLFRCQFSE